MTLAAPRRMVVSGLAIVLSMLLVVLSKNTGVCSALISPHSSLSSLLPNKHWEPLIPPPPRGRRATTTTIQTQSQSQSFTFALHAIWDRRRIPQPPLTPPPLTVWQEQQQSIAAENTTTGTTGTTTIDMDVSNANDPANTATTTATATTILEQLLTDQVQQLQVELDTKQAQLVQQQSDYGQEKQSLFQQLTEFTALTTQNSETEGAQQMELERLQAEIALLQNQLPALQNVLKTEQRKVYELSETIADLDYTLEYQQMEFDAAQTTLQEQLQQAQQSLTKVQQQWQRQAQAVTAQSEEAVLNLRRELDDTREARTALERNQQAFAHEQTRLQQLLTEQTQRLEQQQLSQTTTVQQQMAEERTKVEQAQLFLREAETAFAQLERDLNNQLTSKEQKVQALQERLTVEQETYDTVQAALRERLRVEEGRVMQLSMQLSTERLQATKDQRRLEELWKEEIRLRKLKKVQMNQRYQDIRSELTTLWQGALRDGRNQIATLTLEYTSQTQTLRNTVTQLQHNVTVAESESQTLRDILADVKQQQSETNQLHQTEVAHYQRTVSTQSNEIERLQTSLVLLQETVSARNDEIKAMEQKQKQNTSVRKLMAETATLTAQKLLVRPVRRMLQFGGLGTPTSSNESVDNDDMNQNI